MKFLLSLLMATAIGAEGPRIIFTKTFPGSNPAFVEITLERTGEAVYKEDPKDDRPLTFKLNEADTTAMFEMAAHLDYFAKPLESGLKVAFMGAKTFRYEGDGAPTEAKFNYSEDLEAKALLDWFERISETERAYIDLERAVRFDKLGVHDSLLRIETVRNQKGWLRNNSFSRSLTG